jgi:hypothetical protein
MTRSIEIREVVVCQKCKGSGKVPGLLGDAECCNCEGTGKIYDMVSHRIPPNENENCGRCFYKRDLIPPVTNRVACCRYPPQPRTYGSSMVMSGLHVDDLIIVDTDYWCGEHKVEK